MEKLSELVNHDDSTISHFVDKRHQCELCDTVLDSYRCLKKQLTDIYKGGNLFKCEECIKIIHQEDVIKRQQLGYKCASCGKTFTTKICWQRHIEAVHEGRKDHECKSCGKRFSQRSSMIQHIKHVHEGRKDYKCDSCGKSFSQAGTLRRHINTIHEGRNDYKCESCGKQFSQDGSLKRHIHTVHKGHKDYKM